MENRLASGIPKKDRVLVHPQSNKPLSGSETHEIKTL